MRPTEIGSEIFWQESRRSEILISLSEFIISAGMMLLGEEEWSVSSKKMRLARGMRLFR